MIPPVATTGPVRYIFSLRTEASKVEEHEGGFTGPSPGLVTACTASSLKSCYEVSRARTS